MLLWALFGVAGGFRLLPELSGIGCWASGREARLRRPKRPSGLTIGETDDSVDECAGFVRAGVRSFHAATMLRTEARGERGEVCGRRKDETVGEIADELVALLASAKVLENVLAKSLGLRLAPLLPVIVVGPLVGGAKRDEDDKASEAEEMAEPALLFAGDEGRDPYPEDEP